MGEYKPDAEMLRCMEYLVLPLIAKLDDIEKELAALSRKADQIQEDVKAIRRHGDYMDIVLEKVGLGYESVRSDVTRLTSTVEPCVTACYSLLSGGGGGRICGRPKQYDWYFTRWR